jgi:hypothetical protein
VPCKGKSMQPVKVRPKEVSVHLGSYPGGGAGDQTIEAPGDRGPPSGRVGACLTVKPVREPDDRNGHVRFDERGGETEPWASRRELATKVAARFRRRQPCTPPRPSSTLQGRIALISLATTFTPISRVDEARDDVMGRPGLNPLRADRIRSYWPHVTVSSRSCGSTFAARS